MALVPGRLPGRGPMIGKRSLVDRRGATLASSEGWISAAAGAPKTEAKTASKASACARSETNTERAVK